MEIFTTRASLSVYLQKLKLSGKTVGFVPTMGALHQGHISLIEQASAQADLVVCSIFVNPTQFNDPKDLDKYPRPLQTDKKKLEDAKCDVLFLPTVEEMYSQSETWTINLHGLDNILEGSIRPGHYQGVTQIVKKLFDVVSPDYAFFGQKDYQQFMVISEMVKQLQIPVELVMCPIVREDDGLAMSSRNIHLSVIERQNALALNKSLQTARAHFKSLSIIELKEEAVASLQSSAGIDLEYFEICDGKTLIPADNKNVESLVALVAARVGNTRLIDNIILKQ